MAETEKRLGNCRFCGVELDSDSYCSGCGEFICLECDVSCGEIPFGPHSSYEHRISPDDEEDDEYTDEEEDEA